MNNNIIPYHAIKKASAQTFIADTLGNFFRHGDDVADMAKTAPVLAEVVDDVADMSKTAPALTKSVEESTNGSKFLKVLKNLGLFGGTAVGGAAGWSYTPKPAKNWLKSWVPHISWDDPSKSNGESSKSDAISLMDPVLLGSGGALLGGLGAYSMTDKEDENRAIKALLGAGGGGLLGYLLAHYLKQNAGA